VTGLLLALFDGGPHTDALPVLVVKMSLVAVNVVVIVDAAKLVVLVTVATDPDIWVEIICADVSADRELSILSLTYRHSSASHCGRYRLSGGWQSTGNRRCRLRDD